MSDITIKQKDFNYARERLKYVLGDFFDLLARHDAIVAGGAVTSAIRGNYVPINDIDVYFRTPELLRDFLEDIEGEHERIVYLSDKAFCIKMNYDHESDIQIVYCGFYPTPNDVFEVFDFTCVMGAYMPKSDEFFFDDRFLQANLEMRLEFNDKTLFPLISLMRAFKYQRKGYYVSKAVILQIFATCVSCKIETWKEAKAQIGGMYGMNVDKILDVSEDEPFSYTELMDKLRGIRVDEKVFDTPRTNSSNMPPFLAIVHMVTGTKFKGYKVASGATYIEWGGSYKMVGSNSEMVEIVEQPEPLTVYKIVTKTDGVLRSIYQPEFKYPERGTVVDTNDKGLHFCLDRDNAAHTFFSQQENRYLLTCRVKWENVLSLTSREIKATECEVLEVESVEAPKFSGFSL